MTQATGSNLSSLREIRQPNVQASNGIGFETLAFALPLPLPLLSLNPDDEVAAGSSGPATSPETRLEEAVLDSGCMNISRIQTTEIDHATFWFFPFIPAFRDLGLIVLRSRKGVSSGDGFAEPWPSIRWTMFFTDP